MSHTVAPKSWQELRMLKLALTLVWLLRIISLVPVGSQECPLGYHYSWQFRVCWKADMRATYWTNARRLCREDGGDLAILNTPQKLEAARSALIPGSDAAYLLVGAKIVDGGWHWTDGTPVYVDMWSCPPPEAYSDDCLAMRHQGPLLLRCLQCAQGAPFLCEVRP